MVICLPEPEGNRNGQSYTALSRARSLDGLLIESWHESRFLNLKNTTEMTKELRSKKEKFLEYVEEKNRLRGMFDQTKKKFGLIRSNKKRRLDEITSEKIKMVDQSEPEEPAQN